MVTELMIKKNKGGRNGDDGIVDGGPSRAKHNKGGQRTKMYTLK
jgi:hypothetical protein